MTEFMKLGYVTATTVATLTLGTGILTTSIAFSAEERVKADRVADKLERAAEKVAEKLERAAEKLESRHSFKSDIASFKRYFVE